MLSSCFERQLRKSQSKFMLNVKLLFWRATAEKPLSCWTFVLKGNSGKATLNSCLMLSSCFEGQQRKSHSQFLLNVELLFWRAKAEKPLLCWTFVLKGNSGKATLNSCLMLSSCFERQWRKSQSKFMLNVKLLFWRATAEMTISGDRLLAKPLESACLARCLA